MTTSGIGAIINIENNKIFAFKSVNLEKMWEIYQNQLNLNIHHNKHLQNDWNYSGGEIFEFNIIEEIDDNFLLDDGFVDYVISLDNTYNDFDISSYFFEYLGETTLNTLYDIIGRDECSSEFLDKLKSNELSIEIYDEIKNEMLSLIDEGSITEDEIEDKIDELVQERSHQIRVINLDMQYKLMNKLEDIIGIAELNEDFRSKLNENNLPDTVGFTIQENIMELIFSNNVLDNNIEKQIDSCIEIFKEIISQEILEKLTNKADNLENDKEFINKLKNSNLSKNNGLNVITQLKEFINSGIVTEDNFSLKLDELIDIEIEYRWAELKQDLLTYLSDTVNSQELKNKIESNYLDISLLSKINQFITNSIENKKINSKNEIDETIEKLINEEILKINNLKDELLSYLNNTYGSEELSETFKTILNNAQLSMEDGREFISNLSYNISSFKIKSVGDIKKHLDDLIFDKNKLILFNLLYHLVGKEENNVSFSKKLKLNYLTETDGNIIRIDLLNLIEETKNLNEVLELRNSLEYKLDEMIESKGQLNYHKLIKLSNELINSVNDIIGDKDINDSFKEVLYSHNLGVEYSDLIKEEITKLIEFEGSVDFESKMQQLTDLKNKGVDVTIDEIIQRKAAIRSDEYKLLKSQLISQLNDLIGADNNQYFEKLLHENHLSNYAASNIRSDFNEIIISDDVYDVHNFNYKYEELCSVKNKTINVLLLELVQKQKNIYNKQIKDLRFSLLEELYSIIGKSVVIESFKNRLYSNQLSLDYAGTFKKSMENFINSEEVFDTQFDFKLDELFDLKRKGVNIKLGELINKESQIKLKKLNALKKELTFELNNLTDDIKFKEKLKSNNLNSKTGNDIKNEINTLINSSKVIDSKFNYKLEELDDLNKKTIAFKLDELIQKHSLIYDKSISKVRRNLHDHVNTIMGQNKIKIGFKELLHDNLLHECFADEIRLQMNNFIDSDEVFNKEYEFKLDELSDTSVDDVISMIGEIIEDNRLLKESELKNIRESLNNELIALIGEVNNEYYTDLLNSNNLNTFTGVEIRKQLSDLINSDVIVEDSFEFKLDELISLKEFGLDKKLSQIIEIKAKEYKEILEKTRAILIEDLNKSCESVSFKNNLHNNKLHYSYKEVFKQEVLDLINSDEIYDDKFEIKLDELMDLKEKSIEVHLDELIKREQDIKENELINLRKELNSILDDLIGLEVNNEYYVNLLKSNNLNNETGNAIRSEIVNQINSEDVIDDKYEFKLDELIVLKQKGLKNHLNEIIKREENNYNKNLKSIREKLLNSLNLIISKNSFKEQLYSKQIDDSFIGVINQNLSEFINYDEPFDNRFEVKLDELLFTDKKGIKFKVDQLVESESKIRQNELEQLKIELGDELYSIIGKENNSMRFTYKLVNNNLNDEIKEKIRLELIDLIFSDECQDSNFNYKLAELKHIKEYGVENKIDDIVKREVKIYNEALKEKRDYLIDLTNSTMGKNKINFSLKNKLNSNGLEETFADEIKRRLIEFINTDEVYDNEFKVKLDELIDLENKGIESKIDEIIEDESHKRTLVLRENLLKELYHITGDIPLSEEFLSKLNNADFDEEFGIEIIKHFKSEIDTLNIEEGFDFDKAIDEMILDESKNILLKQTYEIIGKKSNSDYFTNKLKNNMISTQMGEDIRLELLSMIDDSDLDSLIELRRTSMQNKFDDIISREHTSRINKLAELREKLLNDLNNCISGVSFKNELRNKNLSVKYVDKIKNEIEKFIKSDEVMGDFEFKVDELIDLNEKGINSKITEIMERESNIINIEFVKIKSSLLNDLRNYEYKDNAFNLAKIELNKRDLTPSTGKLAYDELYDIISSNHIDDSKFTSKFDELENLKNTTIKTKFIEIIDKYSKNQRELIKFLYSKTRGNSSFNQKLMGLNLHDDFVNDLIKSIEVKIKDNEYTKESEITQAINHYVDNEAVEQDKSLTKLYDIIGKKGINLKFRAKLRFKGLSSSDGKIIAQNIEDKIKTEGLKVYKISEEIDSQIKNLLDKKKNNSRGKSTINQQKYVFCSQCGHKNINGSNFCEECGSKLSKL